eukprot:10864725-Alexandrium_andersonii.AAC.1
MPESSPPAGEGHDADHRGPSIRLPEFWGNQVDKKCTPDEYKRFKKLVEASALDYDIPEEKLGLRLWLCLK